MALGKIIWFGGFNTQKNKVNDYGFIHPLEDNITQDIYVHRTQIPETIQPLLESTQGRGIHVTFDLDTENPNKSRAIRVKLYTQIGIVQNYSMIESDSLIRSSFKYNSDSTIKPGQLVRFAVKCQKHIAIVTNIAIVTEVISINATDREIINHCFNSLNYAIFTFFFSEYLHFFSLAEIAKNCLDKLEIFSSNKQEELLNLLVKNYPQIIINYPNIRKLLSEQLYFSFVEVNLDTLNPSQANTVKQEIITILTSVDESTREHDRNYSTFLQNQLAYHNHLWHLAPKKFKKQIIQQKYQLFFDLLTKLDVSEFLYSKYISYDWKALYNLDENDLNLVKKWIGDNSNTPFLKSTMISARGAEKLVIRYYQSLGDSVEDISIHQITNESDTWRKGDIRLNQQELLDVKNARYQTNSNTYSEFCVPKFKQNRNAEVKIIAVISPYLMLSKIYDKQVKGWQHRNRNPIILGTFTATELAKLEFVFSNGILKVNMNRLGSQANYLPPWLFDYDDLFYQQQLQIIKQIQKIPSNCIPSWEDISLFREQNFINLLITAKKQIPSSWLEHLDLWAKDFINLLLEVTETKITLPYLFLSLLRHFLTMLSVENTNYSPQRYKELLYGKNTFCPPLKIYDPLNIIDKFCDTLNTLWNYRTQYKLQEFKIFKFNGRGLLQGQRFESEYPPTTILAYCGGWTINSKGKCGYTPLVIGKDEICPECHHLICPKDNCGYCSSNCSGYKQRQEYFKARLEEEKADSYRENFEF